MFAFGMVSDLLHQVHTYKSSTSNESLISMAFYRCQADRKKLSNTLTSYSQLLLLCNFFISVAFVVSLQAQGENISYPKPAGLVWEASLDTAKSYRTVVASLLEAYEEETGVNLSPGSRGKMGIKINARGGPGLSTPLILLQSVIEAFERRGFERRSILIMDYSTYGLREANILPSLGGSDGDFEGCPVYALDSEHYYDKAWYYDSPLPPSRNQAVKAIDKGGYQDSFLLEKDDARKSFLPMPLLFDVDFWVNLAVGVDDKSLGIDGALANATLWNVSNGQRFLRSDATAAVAIAEIAAIPELNERMLLHFVSLERYQYIGGPKFNSLYTHSEPLLWMSSDPVAMDKLLFDRINGLRRNNGFPEIDPLPQQLPFAASLGLGVFDESLVVIERITKR